MHDQYRTDQDRTDQYRTDQDRTDQDRTDQDRTDQDRTGPTHPDPIHPAAARPAPVSLPGLTGRVIPVPDGRPPVVMVLPRPLAAVLPRPRGAGGARTASGSSAPNDDAAASSALAGTAPAMAAGSPNVQDRAVHEVTAATCWLVPRLVEVLRGHRPASQLADRLAPFPYADLLRRTRLLARAGDDPGSAALRSVHCQVLRSDAVEVAVHVQVTQRSVALALRWERHHRSWLCTVLDFGPQPFTLRAPAPDDVTRTVGRR